MMRIKVTAKHIKEGRKTINDGHGCPVGRAMVDAGLVFTYFYWDGKVEGITLEVPPSVMKKIEAIHAGKKVKPFSFELKLS